MSDTSTAVAAPAAASASPPSLAKELGARVKQFEAALPSHMPADRFARVILTAIQRNPKLQFADRQSLWNSAMQAAQDGLLPDGREGALVIYRTKAKVINESGKEMDAWIEKVQWMPMIAGIRKKVRNSGEITDWQCQVVYARDEFDFQLGDDPFIHHKPFVPKGAPSREVDESDEDYAIRVRVANDPGPVTLAYSIAIFKTGEKSREVMTRAQIDRVRAVSRAANDGPWVQWFDEMARKTVARRHSKTLPLSTDLDDLIRRDDELYNFSGARQDREAIAGGKAQSLSEQFDRLADFSDSPAPSVSRETESSKPTEPTSENGKQETSAGNAKSPAAVGDAAPANPPQAAGAAPHGSPAPAAAGAGAVGADAKAASQESSQAKASAPQANQGKPATSEKATPELLAEGQDASDRGTAVLNVFLDRFKGQLISKFGGKTLERWREIAAKADVDIAREESAEQEELARAGGDGR